MGAVYTQTVSELHHNPSSIHCHEPVDIVSGVPEGLHPRLSPLANS
jgi:hypothetical protein